MVYGVGHDQVHIPRIERILARWGESFLARIFTEAERAYCGRFAHPAPHLAARFAAKEAFYKALSQGRTLGLGFRDVGVATNPGGAPELELSARAKTLLADAGVIAAHLSLTHEHEYASAFVVLEKG